MKNYQKLLGRMKECGYTQAELAEKIGITSVALNNKLKGIRDFKGSEIENISVVLGISNSNLHEYFFSF